MSQADYAVDPRRELNTLEALKAYAIQDPYWKGLLTSYANIIDHIIAYRVDRDPKKFGSQAAYMTGLSGIATLLAAAQVTFIQVVFTDPLCITTTSPEDCGNNSVVLRDIIIFLTYIALAFEILGAVSSLLTAKRLIELSNHSRALLEAKSTLEKSISGSSSSANPPSELLLGHQKETASLFSEIDVHVHHRKHSAGGLRTVIVFILAGMICFFAALFFEVVISQPARLSGPFIAAVVIMVAVLAWIEKRASPELRKRFRRTAGDEEIALQRMHSFSVHQAVSETHTRTHLDAMITSGDPDAASIISSLAKHDQFRESHVPLVQGLLGKFTHPEPKTQLASFNAATHYLADPIVQKSLKGEAARHCLESLLVRTELDVREDAFSIISRLAANDDVRTSVAAKNIVDLLIPALHEDSRRMRRAATKTIACVLGKDDVQDCVFSKEDIAAILRTAADRDDVARRSALFLLGLLRRRGVVQNPDCLALSKPKIQPTPKETSDFLESIIREHNRESLAPILNGLLLTAVENVGSSLLDDVQESYIQIIETVPSMSATDRLMEQLYSNDTSIRYCGVRLLLSCAQNPEFRQRVCADKKADLLQLLEVDPSQAHQVISFMAQHAQSRRELSNLDSPLLVRLSQTVLVRVASLDLHTDPHDDSESIDHPASDGRRAHAEYTTVGEDPDNVDVDVPRHHPYRIRPPHSPFLSSSTAVPASIDTSLSHRAWSTSRDYGREGTTRPDGSDKSSSRRHCAQPPPAGNAPKHECEPRVV
ncbi:hypothetical protein HMN09_01366100 [Mycena chlorophos]|uniref:Uncharacterized protein n=1 Tax=Mycena chlorophos TaxID=658473 RepID=A0A8H6VP18_MYCCL|nr:hypothetical protein HMN09_01366100 [Mycena chlorophos]